MSTNMYLIEYSLPYVHHQIINQDLNDEEKALSRQAYAGLCWTKQFFSFDGTSALKGM